MIDRIGYDERHGRLLVRFVTGHVYAYRDVPRAVYDGLANAASAGTFFNDHIRDRYAFDRADGRRTYPLDDETTGTDEGTGDPPRR